MVYVLVLSMFMLRLHTVYFYLCYFFIAFTSEVVSDAVGVL
jgi:hypothetical protein